MLILQKLHVYVHFLCSNNNNDNVNTGNIGAMQMNMNMVMVGRQLEQFKRDKKRIKAKLKAMKKAANVPERSFYTTPPNTSKSPETSTTASNTNEPWMSDLKNELTEMLDGIPVEEKKENTLGSLWSFWNVVDSTLLSRKKRSLDSPSANKKACPKSATDYALMGLSFVDFWQTATSYLEIPEIRQPQSCLNYEMCNLSRENKEGAGGDPLLAKIEAILSQGAAFYLHNLDNKINVLEILEAADLGKTPQANCTLFLEPQCF